MQGSIGALQHPLARNEHIIQQVLLISDVVYCKLVPVCLTAFSQSSEQLYLIIISLYYKSLYGMMHVKLTDKSSRLYTPCFTDNPWEPCCPDRAEGWGWGDRDWGYFHRTFNTSTVSGHYKPVSHSHHTDSREVSLTDIYVYIYIIHGTVLYWQ